MGSKKEEFLAKLLEMFKVESAEHLEAISAGLVALEGGADQEPIIESIFREAHSLKGAARSVSITGVEALCREIENIFSAMKYKKLTLTQAMFDAIHSSLNIISALCASPGAAVLPDVKEKEKQALAILRQIVSGSVEKEVKIFEDAVETQFSIAGSKASTETKLPSDSTRPVITESDKSPAVTMPKDTKMITDLEPPITTLPVSPETVRISMQKLRAILGDAEELVGAKLAANEHVAELRSIVTDLANWNKGFAQLIKKQRHIVGDATVASELFKSKMLYIKDLENSLHKLALSMNKDSHTLGIIADSLLENTKKALMVPCSYLFNTFPKLARELAREQNKEAELIICGEDIEIDRRILDELKDSFVHMLRNCVDHGIEKPDRRKELGKPSRGVITITVTPILGNRVEIRFADDGAGIDPDKVKNAAIRMGLIAVEEASLLTDAHLAEFIFRSGLSTSPIITDISGRGLGLAIGREKVEKLGGTITVTSMYGAGTTFSMLVPVSLATFRGVFVEAAGQCFAIPSSSVVRVDRVKPHDIKTIENRQTIALGGHAVSLVRLKDVLGLIGPDVHVNNNARPVVVIRAFGRQVAFLVDDILGEQELLVKSLGPQLVRVRNVSGAAISGTGAVIPVLNAFDLVDSASIAGLPTWSAEESIAPHEKRGRLLIAEDSITARTLLKTILEGAGYDVLTAVDGIDALTKLKTESFDILVSDVDMPRMNGFELTARIRADKNLSELPVVLVTALSSQKDREYGVEVGANAYIVKSDFDQSNLLDVIKKLI